MGPEHRLGLGAAVTEEALSERALGFLIARGCMPPGFRPETLVAWLDQRGLPRFPALLEWESALARIRETAYLPRSPCKEAAGGCRLGLLNDLVALRNGVRFTAKGAQQTTFVRPLVEHRGDTMILFGEDGIGGFFYLAEDGRVFLVSPPFPAEPVLVAMSPWIHLERTIVRALAAEAPVHDGAPDRLRRPPPHAPVQLRCEGDVAAALASALGLPAMPEASDSVQEVRGDARFLLCNSSALFTDVSVRAQGALPVLLAALADIGRPAFLLGTAPVAYLPVSEAPPLGPPDPALGSRVALWAPPGVSGWLFADGDTLVQISGRDRLSRRRVAGAAGAAEKRWCLLEEADLSDFSPTARAYLLGQKARRDPVDAPSPAELDRALGLWGLTPYPALHEANAAWAGFTWGGDAPPNQIGTYPLLMQSFPFPDPPLPPRKPGDPRDKGLSHEGRELVLFGATPSTTMYLDHDGSLLEHEYYANVLTPSADSLRRRIEAEALLETVTGTGGQYLEGAVAGSVGEKIAAGMGLTVVPEASCPVNRWWTGEHVSVNELFSPVSGERITAVLADDETALEQALALGR